jgi:hypothetical protein
MYQAPRFNFSNILNNASKTLNVVNQAIPIIKEVKPIIKNAQTVFKIVNSFNNQTTKEQPIKKENIKNPGPNFFI